MCGLRDWQSLPIPRFYALAKEKKRKQKRVILNGVDKYGILEFQWAWTSVRYVVIVPVLIEHFHLVIKRLLAKPITVGDGTQNAIITTAPLNKICRLSMALFAIRLQKPIRLNQHQPEGHC
jgi:hypothetical protein